LPQVDLPHDPRILRTIVEQNRLDQADFGRLLCAGIYADGVKPDTVRRGDLVRCLD
jgi:hypothetical protein